MFSIQGGGEAGPPPDGSLGERLSWSSFILGTICLAYFSHPVAFNLFVTLNLTCSTSSLIPLPSLHVPRETDRAHGGFSVSGDGRVARLPHPCLCCRLPRPLPTAWPPCASANPGSRGSHSISVWGSALGEARVTERTNELCHLGFR